MERSSFGLGSAQFKVKYKETALYSGPSGISGYVGTLKKGAVMEVVANDHPYYYRVKLDNGLEGYVYKAAGELSSGLSLTRLSKPAPAEETARLNGNSGPAIESSNGAIPPADEGNSEPGRRPGSTRLRPVTRGGMLSRPAPIRPASGSSNGRSANGAYASGSGGNASRNGRGGSTVVITSGEIAVFDKPGIVGAQVGKLRRGEKVSVMGEDSFFYQVMLPNGQAGYIPRYAAEAV